MTYTTQNLGVGKTPGEGMNPTAKQLGNLDKALFDQDARVTTLEATVADLLARVVVLEGP